MQAESTQQQNIKWVDGLRGLASVLVVASHLTFSLAPFLLAPALDDDGTFLLFQMPIVRNLFIGRPSVAVFTILVGFANALKPIKQIRSGQQNAALSSIARGAFKRTCRFIIPSAFVTIISWLFCQFGAYSFSKTVDSQWIRDSSPVRSPSLVSAFTDLFQALFATWTTGGNPYDSVQWTLCFLLKGSMLVSLMLFATAYIKLSYRLVIYGILYCYYFSLRDSLLGPNIFVGLFMAELQFLPSMQDYVERRPLLFAVMSSTAIFLGLFANSFPEEKPEWADWSETMIEIGRYIFPGGSELARFYPSIGAQLLCLGLMFNNTAKRLLSSPFACWLGKHSFAVYLIHAPLVRTLFTWMAFGLSSQPPAPRGVDDEGNPWPRPFVPLSSPNLLCLTIPLFYVLLYGLAMLWVTYVDALCGNMTSWLEARIFQRGEAGSEKPLPKTLLQV